MGFAAVKEERCGLCVKASEEKMVLEEPMKPVEVELREARASEEPRRKRGRPKGTKNNAWLVGGGGGEEERIEDEVVVVPAADASVDPRVRRRNRKRKAMGIEEEPRDVKKVKIMWPEIAMVTARGKGKVWTAEDDAALTMAVLTHGADLEKILDTASEVLGDRTAGAIQFRYCNKIKK